MIIDDFYINYNISFVTSTHLATGDTITNIAYNFQIGVSQLGKLFWMFVQRFGMSWYQYICLCHQKINGNPLQMSSMRDGTSPIV